MKVKIMQDDVNLEIDNRELDLERLIVDGANARIPVEVEFPIYHEDGRMTYEKYGVTIKPLKSSELNNATQIGLADDDTDVNTEIVKRGLCRKNGELFPPAVAEQLPAGVINALVEKIFEVSGIKTDKQANTELLREMMGF